MTCGRLYCKSPPPPTLYSGHFWDCEIVLGKSVLAEVYFGQTSVMLGIYLGDCNSESWWYYVILDEVLILKGPGDKIIIRLFFVKNVLLNKKLAQRKVF